jgi:hypothetical protein
MADVARIAGVSKMSVSCVFTGQHAGDEVRARVLDAVRKTGYVADAIAGAFSSMTASSLPSPSRGFPNSLQCVPCRLANDLRLVMEVDRGGLTHKKFLPRDSSRLRPLP